MKTCRTCGAVLERKRYADGKLESPAQLERRVYCDYVCTGKGLQKGDEPTLATYRWRSRKFLKPACEVCGADKLLHIHHNDEDPRNNDPANLITLCAKCHKRHHKGVHRLPGAPPIDPAKVSAQPRCVCEHIRTRHLNWRREVAGACQDCECDCFRDAALEEDAA